MVTSGVVEEKGAALHYHVLGKLCPSVGIIMLLSVDY